MSSSKNNSESSNNSSQREPQSPFFKEYGSFSARPTISPFFNEGINTRYGLPPQIHANREKRPNILSQAFSEGSEGLYSSRQSGIAMRSPPPLPSLHNPALPAIESYPNLPYFSRTPRKMIPKNTVLTLLETASSRFILFLLISPILALLAGFAGSHWKYTQHTAYCARTMSGSTPNEMGCSQDGNSLVFRSLVQGSSLRSSIIPVFSSPTTDRLEVVIKATSPDKEETLRASYSLDRWQELSYIQPDGTVSFGLPLPFLDLSDFSTSPTITMNVRPALALGLSCIHSNYFL